MATENRTKYRVAILEHAKQTGCNDSQAIMDALLMRHVKKSDFPAMPFGYSQDGFFIEPPPPDVQAWTSTYLAEVEQQPGDAGGHAGAESTPQDINPRRAAEDLPDDPAASRPSFGEIITRGLARFEEHYRLQGIARSDEEWKKLCHSLRQPLPISFRFTRAPNAAEEEFQQFAEELRDGCHTARGRYVPAPHMFDFAKMVSLGCDDRTLKQEQREAPEAPLARLGRWLSRRVPEGLISRQEVVSAVPVALLGVEPGHTVLDVCAAPGSKTLQAIEKACPSGDSEGTGAVVANELSATRAWVLARRCALLGPAAGAVAVVQHKAQVFPGPGLFDRIICDVPCSGDGTMRKHPEKWRSWSPHLGRELHARQLQIAMRGLALLRVGGQMTYSTCSFNPLENEAVVASLLHRTDGAVVLKRPQSLQGLPVRPGLQHWEVVDESVGLLTTYDDILRLPKMLRRRYRRSMWPPKNAKDLNLQRCVRCVPFLANTGGFFVAVLAKVREWPAPGEPLQSSASEASF
ncbi:NSUN2 [Symbiodinium natans]|uniref:NSUN2 protein n=1 Tax=Symbiodinium natans TaxID=878477 RepID=A0A812UJN2_9DINO|nr:NSUN2 [Symbiodinium natans]